MTREEAILLSAYTGFLLVPDFSEVHKFCEDTLGRPIWTHEFADQDTQKEIQEKLRPRIMELIQNISALRPVSREQVEKVFSGCEMCREEKEVKSDNFCGAATMRIVGDSIDLRGDEKKIKFFGHTGGADVLRQLIEAQPTLTPPNEWVSVEERMPDKELEDYKRKYPGENRMEVIVHIVDAKEPTVLEYDGECFADALTGEYHITHWMPLPAPPDSQKKGEKRMIRLRELREKRGLSMKDAADLLNMPYTTYVNYEKGTREPNIQALFRLANFFGVSIDDLLGRCAPNEPLTLDELREMDGPVWVACKPIEGGNGYWCLCQRGNIVTPAGSIFDVKKIPNWVFYRRPPEGEA